MLPCLLLWPMKSDVNATGLRTALRRCDLGAELPHLADSGHRATVNLAFPKTTLSTQSDAERQIEFELFTWSPTAWQPWLPA